MQPHQSEREKAAEFGAALSGGQMVGRKRIHHGVSLSRSDR